VRKRTSGRRGRPRWRHRVGRRWCRQRSARSTRPPSNGAAGIRLKIPSSRFIHASQPSAHAHSAAPPTWWSRATKTPKTPASTKLVTGPTAAMRASTPGDSASPSSSDTPPNSQNVMRRTPMPLALGDDGVRHLVSQQRREEQNGRGGSHEPSRSPSRRGGDTWAGPSRPTPTR